ncbi:MAG: NAD(P)H-dependent oxidoreductase [Christensenellales bacterium]|jgi:predicted homoserine dehydrogenase-like protein
MLGLNNQLAALEERGDKVRLAVVGAGQMGRGMISQIMHIKGMQVTVVADININAAVDALKIAGLSENDYEIVDTLSRANDCNERGKVALTQDAKIAIKANSVQAVVDATGVPDVGARVAYDTILEGKHIILLTVETDVVVGSILSRMAKSAGVVYTGTAGDEPGSLKEMYDFAIASGYEVRSVGKGPNNKLEFECTPDTVRAEALSRGMNPKMLCSFKDNTKTMVELCAISNATGLVADIPGCHGGEATPATVTKLLSLKSEGGILNRYGVVEYVHGLAPGVFLTFSTPSSEVRAELTYLKMGDGPNFLLYRPYHLCSLETPLTVAKAVLDNVPTIEPIGRPVSETLTKAKKDLVPGELLDGIGGFTVRGWLDTHKQARVNNWLPIGLITPKTKVKRHIKKGELLTYDDVELDQNTFIYQLRRLQDMTF